MFNFIVTRENVVIATAALLKRLKVPYTLTRVKDALLQHPDYPSLLSVSDVLEEYSVENISMKTNERQLEAFTSPFIVQILNSNRSRRIFTVVSHIDERTVRCYDPEKHVWISFSRAEFSATWTGVVLVADALDQAMEKDYMHNRKKERQKRTASIIAFLAFPLIAVAAAISAFMHHGMNALPGAAMLFIALLGSIVGALLIWYELDQYNPVMQQICPRGKKINCRAVLQSKASKIAGISWSAIGFTYFLGSMLLLLMNGITNSHLLFALSWLNVIALPYTLFSVYYQWRVAKQWCVLCMAAQGLLVAQFLTGLFAGAHSAARSADIVEQVFLTAVIAFVVPFVLLVLLLPAWRQAKEGKRHKNALQRLKHDPRIFHGMLSRQKTVTANSEGLGITLGNAAAPNKVIKVCNPYCAPCAKAHTVIEELLRKNGEQVQVQIIFTATDRDNDKKAPPVKHLLALAEENNALLMNKALDDWYLPEKKDYEAFAARYPVNGKLQQQGPKVEAMRNWCDHMKISGTPTFFINGYQLPEMYNVNDLAYFLGNGK